MNRLGFRVLIGLMAMPAALLAEGPTAPQFFANNTVEYIPGTLPIIIAAPHGGQLEPTDIPDRKSGVVTRDAETDLLARDLAEAITRRTGSRPHLVVCHLKRSKVDCNRDALTGTGGNPKALATWRAFHESIAKARTSNGRGLFLDLHGHSHPEARVEFGYLLDPEQLRGTAAELEALAPVSSLASLMKTSPDPFESLLRGPFSLGGLLELEGFPSVPSPSRADPGDQPYFRGGYNTARYRAGGGADAFFSVQIECPRAGVRDTEANRKRFAEAMAVVLEKYLERHAGLRLRTPPSGVPRGGSE